MIRLTKVKIFYLIIFLLFFVLSIFLFPIISKTSEYYYDCACIGVAQDMTSQNQYIGSALGAPKILERCIGVPIFWKSNCASGKIFFSFFLRTIFIVSIIYFFRLLSQISVRSILKISILSILFFILLLLYSWWAS
jgi:hypothetical protein